MTTPVSRLAPPEAVLDAFGAIEPPVRLPGGRGFACRSGDLVLKPVDEREEARWVADVLSDVLEDGFRVERPVPCRGGDWIADGWCAWR